MLEAGRLRSFDGLKKTLLDAKELGLLKVTKFSNRLGPAIKPTFRFYVNDGLAFTGLMNLERLLLNCFGFAAFAGLDIYPRCLLFERLRLLMVLRCIVA